MAEGSTPSGWRFPARSPLRAELPPTRVFLAKSRIIKGGGAADVPTLGAVGMEVVQQQLAETPTAILSLSLYLDKIRWVFIAVALEGLALTIHARLVDRKRGCR